MRNCLIVANWKLNNNKTTIKNFFQTLQNTNTITNTKVHIAIAPSTIYLHLIKKHIKKHPHINIAAQDVDIHLSGAFTGETSSKMLKEIGVKYVIIGHSERRKYHKENNENIVKKFDIVKKTGLIPILCIGENKEEKEKEKTKFICEQQLQIIFKSLGPTSFENSVIAYEPIWSIGTGKTDTPKNIQKIHRFIRDYIANYNYEIAQNTTIQYGGSVNNHNAENLLIQPDIDGALIGTASLQPNTFLSIIEQAEKVKFKYHKIIKKPTNFNI